jgi:hypothetical protein
MKKWSWLILVVLLLAGATVRAQDDSLVGALLFARADTLIQGWYGDLWAWTPDGGAVPVTEGRYLRALSLSPDGTRLAYLALAPQAIAQLDAGESYIYQYSDVWLLDLASGEHTLIAGQPESEIWQARGRPAWSPDGRRLAWVETVPREGYYGGQVMVYDLDTDTLALWVSDSQLSFADGGEWGLPGAAWGDGFVTYTESGRQIEGDWDGWGWRLHVIDETGTIAAPLLWQQEVSPERPTGQRWAAFDEKWGVALQYSSGWQWLDPLTGERQNLANPPVYQRAGEAGDGLRLQPLADDWLILNPDGTTARLAVFPRDLSMSISPDGTAVAFIGYSLNAQTYMLYLWQNPATAAVDPIPDGAVYDLVWSPLTWVVEE